MGMMLLLVLSASSAVDVMACAASTASGGTASRWIYLFRLKATTSGEVWPCVRAGQSVGLKGRRHFG